MITFYNVSFIANQSHELQDKKFSMKNNQKVQDFQKVSEVHKFILCIYSTSQTSKQKNIFQLQLVRVNTQSSLSQAIYQEKNKNQKHSIKLNQKELDKNMVSKFSFQLWSISNLTQLQIKDKLALQPQKQLFCRGTLDLTDLKSIFCTVAAFDPDQKQFVKGFLSCNYLIHNPNNKPLNVQLKSISIYIFAIKIFIRNPNKHKRAFLTISQDFSKKYQTNNLNINVSENQQEIDEKASVKKLTLRRIQKGWIWYKQIFDLQLDIDSNNFIQSNVQINLHGFDFNTGESTQIAGYKGPLFVDFNRKDEIKFTEFEMIDNMLGSDDTVASIEFKYCEKSAQNYNKILGINSNIYLENAFSPSKFMYDNSSFVSNVAIAKDQTNKSLNLSRNTQLNSSQLMNLNKMNRNVFVKSKFHSIFASNRGIPIDRQERFPEPKKKLTDQLRYYAHKTLDINDLPTRQKYRYSSFGKDTKKCLKVNAFNCICPGSARYRLPSIFDKY